MAANAINYAAKGPCRLIFMPVRQFQADALFCLESRRLRYLKAFPHNFIHRKCAERGSDVHAV
jgi:hypothetical protein